MSNGSTTIPLVCAVAVTTNEISRSRGRARQPLPGRAAPAVT
jgi:hypothetical protein